MSILIDGVECVLLTEVAELCGVGEERLRWFRGGYSHLEGSPKPVRKRFQSCSGARGYVSRWRDKGGIQDLEKTRHFIDLLIELEKENG